MKKLSIIAIVLASVAIIGEIFIFASQDSEEMHRRAIMTDYRVYAPVIPDTLTLAGERCHWTSSMCAKHWTTSWL